MTSETILTLKFSNKAHYHRSQYHTTEVCGDGSEERIQQHNSNPHDFIHGQPYLNDALVPEQICPYLLWSLHIPLQTERLLPAWLYFGFLFGLPDVFLIKAQDG